MKGPILALSSLKYQQKLKFMPTPIPYDYRQKIVQMRKSGKTIEAIAECFPYSLRSLKRVCSRFEKEGEPSFKTKYHLGGCSSPFGQTVRDKIAEVKDGEQGAPYVRSVLMEKHPDMAVPHERTIQRHWKSKGSNRPKGRPKQKSEWTKEPNHTWQIDGKGYIQLGSGEQVSWMNIADEATSSDLQARLFPPEDSRGAGCRRSLPVGQ